MPRRYRKKPVEVLAGLVKPENIEKVAYWCGGHVDFERGDGHPEDRKGIYIATLEGTMRAEIGDYVIRGVKGEFYPCKPDIFEATYELVGEAAVRETGANDG